MIWEKTDIDSDKVREISERYGLDLLAAAILVRRGITELPGIKYFIESDLRYTHSPFLFDEMGDAVDRVLQAKSEGEKVLIYGDRDVDGITSVALLVETLRELGMDVDWGVPMGDEPYGLTVDVVEKAAASDTTLIVAVDCGTTNYEEVDLALTRGIDTVVVDHHNPQETRPPAAAIVNPKLPDSSYPFDGLCACALTAKLRQALALATTPAYEEIVCLVNARPGNDTVIIDGVKLQNLVEVDRLTETIVPGVLPLDQTRFYQFVQGQQITVYDEPVQKKLLSQAFGSSVEIYLEDIAPKAWQHFPPLRDRSLLWMGQTSKLARYGDGAFPGEIEVLVNLFQALFAKENPTVEDALASASELVALGTLADMMPLQDENRVLVRRGLAALAETKRPGLRLLLDRLGLSGRELGSRDIGWQLTPVINASGRMGTPDKAVRLLLSDDPEEQLLLADEVVNLNKERKRIGDDAWKRILPKAQASLDELENKLIVVEDNSVHRGITGILSGRLARRFNVPSAVLSSVEDRIVGSVRSARGFCATDFLKQLETILDDWGGHDAAAGFHLAQQRRDVFYEMVRGAVRQITLSDEADARIRIDAELPSGYMTPDLWELVDFFEPYGQEYPSLVFLLRGAKIDRLDFMGKATQNHVRLLIDTGKYKWPAVYWNAADRVETQFSPTEPVDLVFELGRNYFQNRENLQLVLLDVRPTGVEVRSE